MARSDDGVVCRVRQARRPLGRRTAGRVGGRVTDEGRRWRVGPTLERTHERRGGGRVVWSVRVVATGRRVTKIAQGTRRLGTAVHGRDWRVVRGWRMTLWVVEGSLDPAELVERGSLGGVVAERATSSRRGDDVELESVLDVRPFGHWRVGRPPGRGLGGSLQARGRAAGRRGGVIAYGGCESPEGEIHVGGEGLEGWALERLDRLAAVVGDDVCEGGGEGQRDRRKRVSLLSA